jgi:hypothetical protein
MAMAMDIHMVVLLLHEGIFFHRIPQTGSLTGYQVVVLEGSNKARLTVVVNVDIQCGILLDLGNAPAQAHLR